jgi:CheY-like chemotaxis protein/HPt (histidine-containing phosphotransfer) domain-containing protein
VTVLTDALKSDPLLRQTKFIAVMSLRDRTDMETVRQAGFHSQLHRPFSQSRLLGAIADATVSTPGKELPAPASAAPANNSLAGLHLLVAEDNELNQFVTKETLRRVGCTCQIVSDGQSALEAAQKGKYAAILMDCQMPGMDGLQATQHIRQFEAASMDGRHIPIIALTAEAIQGDREKCLAAGMDGYVTKPIDADELFEAIRSLVGLKPAAPSPGAAQTGHAPPAKPAAATNVPINVEELLGRSMNDAAFAAQTLEKFHQRALKDVELLRRGVADGDVERTTRLAHNLKSVAAHAAAAPLRQLAFEIEQAGARRDLKFIADQLAALDEEARRCAAFVPEALNRLMGKSTPVSSINHVG